MIIGNLKAIAPEAQIIPTKFSIIDLKNLLSIKRFDLEKAELDVKWIMEKQKIQDIPQTIKYNITSFVYERRRPFDPQKFNKLINDPEYHPFWTSITRMKGFFWLANYPQYAFTLQKAGSRIYYSLDQPWWCQRSRKSWGDTSDQIKQAQQFISRFWDPQCGDKRIQFVFISQDLKRQEIEKTIDQCLISEKELRNYEQIYKNKKDPFKGQWKQGQKFFESQGILLEKDGDWQQIDQIQEEEQQSQMINEQKQKDKKKKKK